ncbi:hypothetical protein [Microbacterium sp. A84]|uniref:hypothetical protein n=1 Tax=Microbacterium sp. A84 TaxID=3450715 RepID=UPI003F425CD1
MTRPRIIAALAVTVGVALVLFLGVGVELAFTIAWAVLAGILTLLSQLVLPDDPRADAPEIPAGPERRGTAIAQMAWSLNPSSGAAGELITRRVRHTLRRRLLRHGLDTENREHRDQIDALVGITVWDRLVAPGTKRQDLERALDSIDRLSPTKEKK